MIRDFRNTDLESVLEVWLRASIRAHHFIAAEFWHHQLDAMREVYLPAATSRVFEARGEVVGFSSVYGDSLAALFVLPEYQGKGIGTQLLRDALASRSVLELKVYSENISGIRFYENQGFDILAEQQDVHTGHPEKVMRWAA